MFLSYDIWIHPLTKCFSILFVSFWNNISRQLKIEPRKVHIWCIGWGSSDEGMRKETTFENERTSQGREWNMQLVYVHVISEM